MKTIIACQVNGVAHEVMADTRDTLLDLIRDRVGLSGTKEGCSNGNCGACTVLVDGAPVNACLMLAVEAPGHDIETIEGVAHVGTLHRLQDALVAQGGTQCGFCTPGIVMAAKALLDENSHPSELQARTAIAGNICRCTGYDKIISAMMAASATNEQAGD